MTNTTKTTNFQTLKTFEKLNNPYKHFKNNKEL